ncbi:MAG: FtsH protease activity modulator HflK [Aromatoleum sp.]|jgi:membrane protease subunit HflK|uniref:FtsH protease activity modulator HflK n=1 Tax=Aromatoleum sp. TaxID=2307007 RepID=UPI002894EDC8|nr:FtsH protease activity modulator HflK [Aromatoleum sp.]MDT3670804.1 FtsH protease activity modulator HflK [Aromatoleum sp.]
MSLNDPRWGNQGNDDGKRGDGNRGGNQGPPDLEDIWRDFNQRLAGLFGGRRGRNSGGGGDGGGPQMPQISFRQFGGGIGALLVLILVVWLASGFYIVDANQRGVVLRFGQYAETTEPGLRWRLPYPVESSEIVDLTGVRTVEVGYRGSERNKVLREALMLTDDENIINIQFAVQYVLKSPENYLFNNRFPDESVIQAAETAMREIVGKSKMDFVLYEGREQIAASAHESIQTILDRYDTGILVSRVTMQNAQPPEQVQAAFDDAVKAGQDRERLRNEGEAYANDVIPRARGTASRLIEEANAYRERVVANAEGEASRFNQVYAEYRRAPEVTRERLYLETMQQVMSRSSKVMVDTKGSGNLLYMPLDKLMQATVNPPAPAESAPAAAAPAAPAPSPRPDVSLDLRSRDLLRDRERGER